VTEPWHNCPAADPAAAQETLAALASLPWEAIARLGRQRVSTRWPGVTVLPPG
jgi:hypothetical protein